MGLAQENISYLPKIKIAVTCSSLCFICRSSSKFLFFSNFSCSLKKGIVYRILKWLNEENKGLWSKKTSPKMTPLPWRTDARLGNQLASSNRYLNISLRYPDQMWKENPCFLLLFFLLNYFKELIEWSRDSWVSKVYLKLQQGNESPSKDNEEVPKCQKLRLGEDNYKFGRASN